MIQYWIIQYPRTIQMDGMDNNQEQLKYPGHAGKESPQLARTGVKRSLGRWQKTTMKLHI